tara:strand:- start:87 stop:746 length:660 start_codon:yes stop_codon:yes gene_type:complete
MTLNIITPFAYYVGQGELEDFNFTDLRKDKRITWAPGQSKRSEYEKEMTDLPLDHFHNKYFRILEYHTKLRDVLTYNFNLFLENTYGNILGKISTSWLTCLEEGDRIEPHRHSNCFYSGILYFDEEYGEDAARLQIENPIAKLHESVIPRHYNVTKENANNKSSDDITFRPFKGAYYFFPSTCWHNTGPHVGNPRKSLAFNFVIDSPIYNLDSTYNPKW